MSTSTRFRWLCLVAILGLAAAVSSAWAAAPPTFTVAAASAFLRNEPNAQAPATYSIFQGQVYPILGRNADSSWLQLEVFKATKGTWVLASLGKVTGDLASIPITAGVGQVTKSVTEVPVSPEAIAPTPTAADTGPSEICVLLYDDINGNGKLEPNEGAIAGGQLTILDTRTGAVVAAYTLTPADRNGHCFTDLPAGLYTVAAAAPAGYNATVAASVAQPALPGQHYQIFFGAQPSANAPAPGGLASFFTAGLGGILVVGFLLVAGVAAALLLFRRK
jgi:hypothetical protein